MEAGRERRYVLKGTMNINGEVYHGGTEWVGQTSLVVKSFMVMSWHGRKLLLERSVVEKWFREVEAPQREHRST